MLIYGATFTAELNWGKVFAPLAARFRVIAADELGGRAAGHQVHAARHTAATLALEAGIDVRIVSEMPGHSTTRVTQDLYQHVRVQLQIDAAETAVELLSSRKGVRETGS